MSLAREILISIIISIFEAWISSQNFLFILTTQEYCYYSSRFVLEDFRTCVFFTQNKMCPFYVHVCYISAMCPFSVSVCFIYTMCLFYMYVCYIYKYVLYKCVFAIFRLCPSFCSVSCDILFPWSLIQWTVILFRLERYSCICNFSLISESCLPTNFFSCLLDFDFQWGFLADPSYFLRDLSECWNLCLFSHITYPFLHLTVCYCFAPYLRWTSHLPDLRPILSCIAQQTYL